MTLPLRRGSGVEANPPRWRDIDSRTLEWPKAGHLEIHRKADADQATVDARQRLLLANRWQVDHGNRSLQHLGIITRVVLLRQAASIEHASAVRHLLGADQVATSDLGRLHTKCGGHRVYGPLHSKGRLGPAGTTVGRCERGVGQDPCCLDIDIVDVIRPKQVT